jgi:hypothetical protein
MRNYSRPVDPSQLKVGQRIRITCPRLKLIFRTSPDFVDVEVVEVFDSGPPIGMQIDVRNASQWWRWIPSIDGGSCHEED